MIGNGIIRFSRNQFIFGFVLVRPPLFMFLILSVLFAFINLVTGAYLNFGLWMLGLALFVAGFALALKLSHTDKKIYQSLVNIPKFMFLQVLSVLKIFKGQKNNVATTHYVDTHIDELVNKKNED